MTQILTGRSINLITTKDTNSTSSSSGMKSQSQTKNKRTKLLFVTTNRFTNRRLG